MGKRFIVFLVLICFCFSIFFVVPVQKAEAIAQAVIPAAAVLLIASGVSFSSTSGMAGAAEDFYNSVAPEVRDRIDYFVANAPSDLTNLGYRVADLPSDLYNSVCDWVDSKFTAGESDVTTRSSLPIPIGVITPRSQYLSVAMSHPYVGYFIYDEIFDGKIRSYLIVAGYNYPFTMSYSDGKLLFTTEQTGMYVYIANGLRDTAQSYHLQDESNVFFSGLADDLEGSGSATYLNSYSGVNTSDVVDVAGRDIADPNTGERKIAWPAIPEDASEDVINQTLNQLLEKDYTDPDIINPTVTDVPLDPPIDDPIAPPIDPPAETELGVLGQIWTKIQSIAASATAIGAAITSGLVGDVSSINTTPMTGVGQTLTTKFPFSLPWDLQRSVDIFDNAGQQLGPWNISFPTPFGSSVSFDVTVPEGMTEYFKYLRWALLLMFDIALIFATKRLLGGA